MRAVFDTNVVLSALLFVGRQAWLKAAWADGGLLKVVSTETVAELRRVVAYPKFKLSPERQGRLVAEYLGNAGHEVTHARGRHLAQLCRDPKDRMFVALAVSAGVPLVSGDADLTSLKDQLPIEVLTLAALRDRIGA